MAVVMGCYQLNAFRRGHYLSATAKDSAGNTGIYSSDFYGSGFDRTLGAQYTGHDGGYGYRHLQHR